MEYPVSPAVYNYWKKHYKIDVVAEKLHPWQLWLDLLDFRLQYWVCYSLNLISMEKYLALNYLCAW